MVPRGHGHVVNMASMLGELACPGVAVYCGTKFAVAGFSDAVRREITIPDVHVTTVLPAFVDSDLTAGLPAVRGFRRLTPDEVAIAVADVIDRPRRRVYVPPSAAAVLQVQRVLPARAVDRVLRPFGLHRMFMDPRRRR